MSDDRERELFEEFQRSGRRYISPHGRYVVGQEKGSIILNIHGTALAKENWVYTGEPLLLSDAIALADKWDSEDPGRIILTREAAERLGVSLRRVQQLIKSGELLAIPAGRDWLIDPAYLQHLPPPQKRGPKPRDS